MIAQCLIANHVIATITAILKVGQAAHYSRGVTKTSDDIFELLVFVAQQILNSSHNFAVGFY